MKSSGISPYLPVILLSLLVSFTLPQSQSNDNRTIDTLPPIIPLPPHSSSLIIPPSTFSPDAAASYLIIFTPTSTPPLPLSHDAVDYCFSRLRVLASRPNPPETPFGRQLICTLFDCEVIIEPVTAGVMNYGELEYLLGEVGDWIAGEGAVEGWWDEEGVQRWYRGTRRGQRVALVELVLRGREEEVGGGTGEGGVGGTVDVDR